MNCPQCDSPVSEGSTVCPKCGAELELLFDDVLIATVKRPSRWQYFTGIAVVLITSALAIALLFVGLFSMIPDERFVVPGTHEVELNNAGQYTIFWEYQSYIDGVVYASSSFDGLLIHLYKDDSSEVKLSNPTGNSEYSANGKAGISIIEFEIDEPGIYTLVSYYDEEGSDNNVVLAISQYSLMNSLIRSAIIGTIGFLIGLIIIIRAMVMRRRISLTAGVTPVDKFWC